jgi:acyl dehydratase
MHPHLRGGFFYDDFQVGVRFAHRLRRTVTQMDNVLFSNMTLNPQPLHIDAEFCAHETEWGRPVMNSLFTLGLLIGLSVNDLTVGTTIANLGMSDVRFPNPLFEGDRVNATTEVRRAGVQIWSRRRSRRVSSPTFKQDGTLVPECRRMAFMRKRPFATIAV